MSIVQWDDKKRRGVKMKLEPAKGSVRSEYEDGKERLEGYKIKETVFKVYIKSHFLTSGRF